MAPKPSAEPTPDLIRIVLPTLPGGRDEANIVIDVTRGPSIPHLGVGRPRDPERHQGPGRLAGMAET